MAIGMIFLMPVQVQKSDSFPEVSNKESYCFKVISTPSCWFIKKHL